MVLDPDNKERAEAYRILADLFLKPPDNGQLKTIKEDLELQSNETQYEIVGDFGYLFLYPGGRLPPVESLFISLTETAAFEDVTVFYAEAGLTIDEEFQLMPDHLSLEFLFMSYLIDIGRTDLQDKFLEEHLMNWVPYYCDEIIRHAGTVFYKEVAEITNNFLENEYEGME